LQDGGGANDLRSEGMLWTNQPVDLDRKTHKKTRKKILYSLVLVKTICVVEIISESNDLDTTDFNWWSFNFSLTGGLPCILL
jgi:hypothetical protein